MKQRSFPRRILLTCILGIFLAQASACGAGVSPTMPPAVTQLAATNTEELSPTASQQPTMEQSMNAETPSKTIEAAKADPNYVVRGNLMRSRDAFIQRKTGRVAFLGGSVTNLSWREKVMAFLVQKFPNTTFDFINAGINGTPAESGAFRLEADVFANGPVDLLFLEFAVNGGSKEAMEGIVRHARALSPNIDIIQMHIAARWFSDSLDSGNIPGAVLDHEAVAEHYGNSSLHLYKEVYDQMKEGRFTWDQFAPDGVHPTEFGSGIYAVFINQFLEMMWNQTGEKAEAYAMPSPLTQDPWEHGTLVSFDKASSVAGFQTVKDWMPTLNGNLKRPLTILAASAPGASITFSFRGTKVGVYAPIGPDSAKVEYRIDDRAWTSLDTARDSWYPNDYYRLNIFLLDTALNDSAHIIAIRTIEDQGKVFRFYRLMVG